MSNLITNPLNHIRKQIKDKRFLAIRSQFSYALPAVIVCYPRSGSNFLQNVLSHSSGLPLRSFHQPIKNMQPLYHYGLKSHALSQEWLEDEFSRTTLNYSYPEKIVYVYRDPRDVMISFYEFVQHMKGVSFSQEQFLEHVCYVYSTYMDKDPVLGRTADYAPLSVLDGYRCHYKNWMIRQESSSFCLVKYEDLVSDSKETFQRVFDFLSLNCDLSQEALGTKVSQYDDSNRVRGKVQNWKANERKYRVLISGVESELHDEIETLAY